VIVDIELQSEGLEFRLDHELGGSGHDEDPSISTSITISSPFSIVTGSLIKVLYPCFSAFRV